MRKILLIGGLVTLMASVSYSQSGLQIQAQFGRSDVGFDYWYESTDLTVTAIYPLNGTISIGGFGTYGLGSKYVIWDNNRSSKMNVFEVGLISRYTVARAGKFSFYLQNVFSYLSFDNTIDNESDLRNDYPEIFQKDSSYGLGAGAGVTFLVSPGITLNIFEFDLTLVKKDIITIDRQLHKDYKIGVAIQLGKKK